MPTEVANYIGELDQSRPQGSESLGEADDHLRLTKKCITQTFLGDGASDVWDIALNVGPRYLNDLLNTYTPENWVTLDTAQTITGQKTITAAIKGDIGLVNDASVNLISQTGPSVSVGNYDSPAIILADSATGITQAWNNGTNTATVLNTANFISEVIDTLYPVGTVLHTSDNTNPGTRFAGTTWAAIGAGRFIASVGVHTDANGDSFTMVAGDIVEGEYNHTLTEAEMPSHKHDFVHPSQTVDSGDNERIVTSGDANPASTDPLMATTGGDNSHNNIPPGYGLYVWERTA